MARYKKYEKEPKAKVNGVERTLATGPVLRTRIMLNKQKKRPKKT